MHMYMYMCMHIHVYTNAHTCTCTCTYTHMHPYIYIYTCTYTCTGHTFWYDIITSHSDVMLKVSHSKQREVCNTGVCAPILPTPLVTYPQHWPHPHILLHTGRKNPNPKKQQDIVPMVTPQDTAALTKGVASRHVSIIPPISYTDSKAAHRLMTRCP